MTPRATRPDGIFITANLQVLCLLSPSPMVILIDDGTSSPRNAPECAIRTVGNHEDVGDRCAGWTLQPAGELGRPVRERHGHFRAAPGTNLEISFEKFAAFHHRRLWKPLAARHRFARDQHATDAWRQIPNLERPIGTDTGARYERDRRDRRAGLLRLCRCQRRRERADTGPSVNVAPRRCFLSWIAKEMTSRFFGGLDGDCGSGPHGLDGGPRTDVARLAGIRNVSRRALRKTPDAEAVARRSSSPRHRRAIVFGHEGARADIAMARVEETLAAAALVLAEDRHRVGAA